MNKGYIFLIALRHIFGQKRQSLITIGGVAVGVMVLLVTSALMNGLLVSFTNTITDAAPHLYINGEKKEYTELHNLAKKKFPNNFVSLKETGEPDSKNIIMAYRPLEKKIEKIAGIECTSPFVISQTIATSSSKIDTLLVSAVNPEQEDKVISLKKRMRKGSFDEFKTHENAILLGKEASNEFEVDIDDRLRLLSPSGKLVSVKVAGIYTTGIKALDSNGYIHLKLGQTLEGLEPGTVSGINIKTGNPFDLEALKNKLQIIAGYKVETWQQANSSILSLFKIIRTITIMLVVFTIVVAGFGVANILITIVLGKVNDISLLRSIGFTRSRIQFLFIIEGFIIGLAGSLAGCAFGFVLSTLIGFIPSGGSEFRETKTLYMDQNIMTYLYTSLFSVIVCLLASLGPAIRASKLKPVDVLRGEV